MRNLLRVPLLSVVLCASSFGQTLIDRGRSDYQIVISAQAPLPDQRGAKELQSHLKQMSGVELPLVTDEKELPAKAILVGSTRHTAAFRVPLDPKRLGDEGFVLKTVGDRLVIAGAGPRGTMYGCSDVLEKLGVRWFAPDVTRVPQKATVALPPLGEIQVPAFEYREPFFTEAREKDWTARLRINGNSIFADESTGGKIVYGRFVHTFEELVPRELYAHHPEYFPLVQGQRVDGYTQRCLSNPDVLRMSIDVVKRWIVDNPQATIFSVSQNDTKKGVCQCGECRAIQDKYNRVPAGVYLWFVNQVAEAIEKDHPKVLIDTLAYQFTEKPPKGIVPRKNVRIRLCPIACCQAHPYESCSHPANVQFLANLKRWGAMTDTLYIWHYNTNFKHFLLPFPDFDEFPAEARLYQKTGVKGIFFQGAYFDGGGASDAVLRSYVMAKLLWDTTVDTDALVTEWMQGVYGKAWQPMRKWFDELHRAARTPDEHMSIYDDVDMHYLSDEVLSVGEKLMAEAKRLATDDTVADGYINRADLCVRYARIMKSQDFGPAFRQLMTDIKAAGITRTSESAPMDEWEKRWVERGTMNDKR